MRCSHLDCFSIWHHCFKSCRVECTYELLPITLVSCQDRNCQLVFYQLSIIFEDQQDFLIGIFLARVHCVPFLPKKFACSQEWFRGSYLCAKDGIPNIDEKW